MKTATFNPASYNNKTVSDEMRRQRIVVEMDRNGMNSYKCKKIKKFDYLLGVAKDLDTRGCFTIREYKGTDDIAVYPTMSLREVIDSFSNHDVVAEMNCYYVNTIREAARILRESK